MRTSSNRASNNSVLDSVEIYFFYLFIEEEPGIPGEVWQPQSMLWTQIPSLSIPLFLAHWFYLQGCIMIQDVY